MWDMFVGKTSMCVFFLTRWNNWKYVCLFLLAKPDSVRVSFFASETRHVVGQLEICVSCFASETGQCLVSFFASETRRGGTTGNMCVFFC